MVAPSLFERSLSPADPNLLLNISEKLRAPLHRIAAPLEQLLLSGSSLSESERKHLYGIIGLHTAIMIDLVEMLMDPSPVVAPVSQTDTEKNEQEANAFDQELVQPLETRSAPSRRNSQHDDLLLDKLYGIMEENLEETDFNVDKMCRMVHMSHMHFIRKVKQLTGKKPIDLLKSYRLKRATELLRQNNLNVAEVAYKVGYDMPNSFSRAFKKEYGTSPTNYINCL